MKHLLLSIFFIFYLSNSEGQTIQTELIDSIANNTKIEIADLDVALQHYVAYLNSQLNNKFDNICIINWDINSAILDSKLLKERISLIESIFQQTNNRFKFISNYKLDLMLKDTSEKADKMSDKMKNHINKMKLTVSEYNKGAIEVNRFIKMVSSDISELNLLDLFTVNVNDFTSPEFLNTVLLEINVSDRVVDKKIDKLNIRINVFDNKLESINPVSGKYFIVDNATFVMCPIKMRQMTEASIYDRLKPAVNLKR